MRTLALATSLTLALTGAALAQSSGGNPNSPNTANKSPATLRQQIQTDLQQAGFSDIKVLPESFLVRAKDKRGNPVMMVINPDSVTAVTETTGTGSSNGQAPSSGKNASPSKPAGSGAK